MGLLEEIQKQNDEILTRLKDLEGLLNEKPDHNQDTSIISATDMMNDLGIGRKAFKKLSADMPFLIRIGQRGRFRARRCDYEKWKQLDMPEL